MTPVVKLSLVDLQTAAKWISNWPPPKAVGAVLAGVQDGVGGEDGLEVHGVFSLGEAASLPLSFALERHGSSTRARAAEGWGFGRVGGGHVTATLFGWRAGRTTEARLSRRRSKRTQEDPGLSDISVVPL
jgi:hypothetical protein